MDLPVRLGPNDRIPADERTTCPRYLGFRPADGQVCEINPPRFIWPYDPEVIPTDPLLARRRFRLRIGATPGLEDPVVDVGDTPYNFYNALPVLSGGRRWYWQVTYDPGALGEQVSRVRSFDLAPDAVAWDRTVIERATSRLCGHPRVIFTPENREALLALREGDAECAEIARQAIRLADETLEADWFVHFPETDTSEERGAFVYAEYAQWLQNMAFAFLLTGDEKYLAVKDRLLRLAAYEPGGYASPERIGPAHKFGTKITEHMGVCFDWLYDVLSPSDRDVVVSSLDWRIAHILRSFSWMSGGRVRANGIAVSSTSHAWENMTWTFTGAMAVLEHSATAREFVELGLHYFTGVANGFGSDEGWNEGVSYSNWKFGSLVATSLYVAMTFPELRIERNPLYSQLGEFFLYLTPVGLIRPAWGDIAYQYRYHERGQHAYRRKLAYFTGDRRLLTAWHEWRGAIETGQVRPLSMGAPDINEITDYPRPWIEYALKHFFPAPVEKPAQGRSRLFPVAGWTMGYSEPPGTLESFRRGRGFVFNCRPRGGYSHSHHSNGGFELFAYGEAIATGGGSKSNSDPVAKSSQSHNVVLIDGAGQCEVRGSDEFPNAGRLLAWKETPGLVYACADVRNAYSDLSQLQRFLRHFLFVRDRYFVVFDDLALVPDAPPAVFSWLYHIQPDVPVNVGHDVFDYAVGEAQVRVHHLGETGPLKVENMRGDDWYRNPVTGEDRFAEIEAKISDHPGLGEIWKGLPRVHNNLWISTVPQREVRFLAAILPHRAGESEPVARKLEEGVIEIAMGDGAKEVIAFGKSKGDAAVVVDYEAMRP